MLTQTTGQRLHDNKDVRSAIIRLCSRSARSALAPTSWLCLEDVASISWRKVELYIDKYDKIRIQLESIKDTRRRRLYAHSVLHIACWVTVGNAERATLPGNSRQSQFVDLIRSAVAARDAIVALLPHCQYVTIWASTSGEFGDSRSLDSAVIDVSKNHLRCLFHCNERIDDARRADRSSYFWGNFFDGSANASSMSISVDVRYMMGREDYTRVPSRELMEDPAVESLYLRRLLTVQQISGSIHPRITDLRTETFSEEPTSAVFKHSALISRALPHLASLTWAFERSPLISYQDLIVRLPPTLERLSLKSSGLTAGLTSIEATHLIRSAHTSGLHFLSLDWDMFKGKAPGDGWQGPSPFENLSRRSRPLEVVIEAYLFDWSGNSLQQRIRMVMKWLKLWTHNIQPDQLNFAVSIRDWEEAVFDYGVSEERGSMRVMHAGLEGLGVDWRVPKLRRFR